MNSTRIWIDIAFDDLKSSQILFAKGHYRASYSFFQQATEKADKAFWLMGGQVTEKELFKIQHDQFKIYGKRLVNRETEIKDLLSLLKFYPKMQSHELFNVSDFKSLHQSLNKGMRFIDSLHAYDLVDIPTAELNNLLKSLRSMVKIKLKLPKIVEKKFRETLLKTADWIGQLGTLESLAAKKQIEEFVNDQNNSKELYSQMIQIMPLLMDLLFISCTLYTCALITIQHSSLTRYPSNGNNPLEIYTLQLPLIKKQGDFMHCLESALIKLNKFVDKTK